MIFSALLCRLPIALSQATSSAVKGGIVVVVGGGVVLVLAVLGVDAAVELAVLPPHPVASTVTVRQTARRAGGWHVGGRGAGQPCLDLLAPRETKRRAATFADMRGWQSRLGMLQDTSGALAGSIHQRV